VEGLLKGVPEEIAAEDHEQITSGRRDDVALRALARLHAGALHEPSGRRATMLWVWTPPRTRVIDLVMIWQATDELSG